MRNPVKAKKRAEQSRRIYIKWLRNMISMFNKHAKTYPADENYWLAKAREHDRMIPRPKKVYTR